MSVTPQSCRTLILVKALPHPSKNYGETVCCAGITVQGQWKRLFPVRFRHLSGSSSFKRWDWVTFRYTKPVHDGREESCRVHEESILVDGKMSLPERARFLNPLVVPTIQSAADQGKSLALIRPKYPVFSYKRRSAEEMAAERDAFARAARQTSLFDRELAAIEPTPYEFRFRFEDDRPHDFLNGDWEAHAMFYQGKVRGMSETDILEWMNRTFNEEYPKKGVLFAVGNQAKRPHIWQLLGVLRVDEPKQGELLL